MINLNESEKNQEKKMRYLSEEKVRFYEKRLNHYLSSYRNQNKLTNEAMAKKLGYSVDHYRKLESGATSEGKFISCMDYLTSLAKISDMSLEQFIMYLNNKELVTDENKTPKRELFNWEIKILALFANIDMGLRSKFISFFYSNELEENVDENLTQKKKEKFSKTMKIAIALSNFFDRFDEIETKFFEAMLERFFNEKKNSKPISEREISIIDKYKSNSSS